MSLDPTTSESKPASVPNTPEVQSERPPVALRYFDRAELEETFADSIAGLIFDGQTLRIEFDVTRYDEMKPNSPITGRRYPACRLVLSPAAALDLISRVQQIAAATTQAVAVKTALRPGPEAATPKS
jgi:hypothetical protein